MYDKKSSPANIQSKDPQDREELRKAILTGEAKFSWRNARAERERTLLVGLITENQT